MGALLWLSLTVALLLLLPAATPRPAVLGWGLALAVVLALSLRLRVGLVVVAVLFLAGVGLRVAFVGASWSDVLTVTVAAIERLTDGLNPYGVGYDVSRPPGAPFPYGPLALLWYLPFQAAPRAVEFSLAAAVMLALALRGRALGLAVYAMTPALVVTATDGSNDTSAGVLILLAMVVAERLPAAGGALLGLATAFKPHAAAWVLPLAVWGGLPALIGSLGGAALGWLPAILAWGAGPIADSIARAQAVHASSYYSLGALAEAALGRSLPAAFFDRLRFVAGGAVGLATIPLVRSHRSMVLAGVAIFAVTLYMGYWATFAYLAALAPVVCWYLDEWLGFGERRVVWPGDPAGAVNAAADRRWPRR